MRKSLLLLIMVVLGGAMTLRAQATYFYEFEDDLQEWTTIDDDGDGNTWYSLNPTNNPNNIPGHNGSLGHVTSASYNGTALTPDNYLAELRSYANDCMSFHAKSSNNLSKSERKV